MTDMTTTPRGPLPWLLPILLLAAGAVASIWILEHPVEVENREVVPPPPLVRGVEVRTVDVPLVVESEGTVRPARETTLVAEVAGRVVWIDPGLDEGRFVDEGQPLLRLDARDHELALIGARAEVAAMALRVATERSEADVALVEWQRQGRDGEPDPLVLRKPQLAEAEARLAAARAGQDQAELDLERTTIRAPYDARVVTRAVDLGTWVGRGTAVAHVYGIARHEVVLPVPDRDLAHLPGLIDAGRRGAGAGAADGAEEGAEGAESAGVDVLFSADFAGRHHEWAGRAERLQARIDPRSRMVQLVAVVEDPYAATDGSLPFTAGLFVHARITGPVASGVAVVPRSARRDDGTLLVAVPVDPGELQLASERDDRAEGVVARLEFRAVELLRREGERLLIQRGLAPGEFVIVSPMSAPVEGMLVRVTMEASP